MTRPPRLRAASIATSTAVLITATILMATPGCGARIVDGVALIGDVTVIGVPRLGAAGKSFGYREGDLYQPRAIEALPDLSCVVIDRTGRVQRFAEDGRVTVSWSLSEWSAGQPVDLVATPWGTLLVADTHYTRVLEYDLEGNELNRFPTGHDLELVRGIAVGPGEVIYVAQYARTDRVLAFNRAGELLHAFGSSGTGPGEFLRPEGLTVAANGEVLVVDCGNHRVQRFRPDGSYVGSFGGEGREPGHFLFPFDIAPGSDDTVYVVDYRGNRVQRFTREGRLLGTAGTTGRDPGQFATPRGIAVIAHADGDVVFVADTSNHRVQRFRWEYDR